MGEGKRKHQVVVPGWGRGVCTAMTAMSFFFFFPNWGVLFLGVLRKLRSLRPLSWHQTQPMLALSFPPHIPSAFCTPVLRNKDLLSVFLISDSVIGSYSNK